MLSLQSCVVAHRIDHRVCELVAVLSVDGLAGCKLEPFTQRSHMHLLRNQALQMHLDAACRVVPNDLVDEEVWLKVGVEVAIDSSQDVAIKASGHTGPIVISRNKYALALAEIGSEKNGISR